MRKRTHEIRYFLSLALLCLSCFTWSPDVSGSASPVLPVWVPYCQHHSWPGGKPAAYRAGSHSITWLACVQRWAAQRTPAALAVWVFPL